MKHPPLGAVLTYSLIRVIRLESATALSLKQIAVVRICGGVSRKTLELRTGRSLSYNAGWMAIKFFIEIIANCYEHFKVSD